MYEECRAKNIMESLLGPSAEHHSRCQKCQYEDENDQLHWFGVRKWLVVEKVNEDDLVENHAIAARSARGQENDICKQVSEQRIDMRRRRLDAAKAASIARMEADLEVERKRKLQDIEKAFQWQANHP